VAVLTVALWCTVQQRWTPASWRVPLDYTGDSLEILARIKAAAEGELRPFQPHRVSRLGAPFGTDWSEYPASDVPANYALGQLARFIGVEAASNLALLLGHLTAALSFYGCARLLRHGRIWAGLGALLFAFSYFSFSRGLVHLWVAIVWPVPLALLTCWLVAAGRGLLRRKLTWVVCVGAAAAIGASNPYNLYLYLQLLAWSLVAVWVRGRRRPNLRLGAVCAGAALAMFAATQVQWWAHAEDEGGPPLLARNYAGTEIYALKPIELALPPPDHHSSLLASLGSRYVRWTDWRGESFSPYLGLVGLAALLWVLGDLAGRLLAARGPARSSGPGLVALWILLFAGVGGLNSIIAFYAELQVFRATNRYSIFLLALALLFLTSRLTRRSRNWSWPAVALAAGGLLAIGLWDQVPRRGAAEARAEQKFLLQSDHELGRRLEARLGAGAMVFQLPVVDFPEGSPRHRVRAYDHFRLYIASTTLRFTFGSRKRRATGRWQLDAERLPAVDFARTLEACGFAAISVNRDGFPDEGRALLADLAAAGWTERVEGASGRRVIVPLRAAVPAHLPLAREPVFGRGWQPVRPDDDTPGRWASGPAVLTYRNPAAVPLAARLRLRLSSAEPRTATLSVNGVRQSECRLGPEPQDWVVAFELAPGINRLDVITDRPARRTSERRWSLRAFHLQEYDWTVTPAPGTLVVGQKVLSP